MSAGEGALTRGRDSDCFIPMASLLDMPPMGPLDIIGQIRTELALAGYELVEWTITQSPLKWGYRVDRLRARVAPRP